MLAKISDAGAKANCYLPCLNDLLNEAAARQKNKTAFMNDTSSTQINSDLRSTEEVSHEQSTAIPVRKTVPQPC